MASTVAGLFAAAELEPHGVVRWRTPVPESSAGVYVVALTGDPTAVTATLPGAPLDSAELDRLLDLRPQLKLDGNEPTVHGLSKRLESFWLSDETVLYVGRAGQPLRKRVRQYYRTPLGAKRPHAGGWWLKTLTVLDRLFVHFAVTTEYKTAERTMLNSFAGAVSSESRAALWDSKRVAPFANLRTGDDVIKCHGIEGATGRLND